MKTPAWSYTAIDQFETCPLQYYYERRAKVIPFKETDATRWGNQVHKELEYRVKNGTKLPEHLARFESFIAKATSKGHATAELKYCLNEAKEPVSWFDKSAWVRAITDLEVRKNNNLLSIDYKTGKRRPGSNQLALCAAIQMEVDETIEQVTAGFLWIKVNKLDKDVYTRDDVPRIWGIFQPKLDRLAEAVASDKWIPRPNGLCRAWCPVGEDRCKYCGR